MIAGAGGRVLHARRYRTFHPPLLARHDANSPGHPRPPRSGLGVGKGERGGSSNSRIHRPLARHAWSFFPPLRFFAYYIACGRCIVVVAFAQVKAGITMRLGAPDRHSAPHGWAGRTDLSPPILGGQAALGVREGKKLVGTPKSKRQLFACGRFYFRDGDIGGLDKK